ncbi:hypothetical protein [Alkaliphilus peptidifermentans]|uniref:Uncharacterized protein n=1 Tax=Alkaliphilus peptidifermentans DSM 18978 TaxID=1120976 RepID=A0A1G5I9Q1_9FIRM|nr:hypothetical protein [Alkaliphilus peptidifermentans]SCY72845.1 hypothetical protein SAMN03080606_02299 [Alkaliphilus peptidifermentans DSM 18978]
MGARMFFGGFGLIWVLINIGLFAYMIYLFHTLAMSNKKIADTLEHILITLESKKKE